MGALSSEGVISVDATLILASERAGPPEMVKTLKATSVPYVSGRCGPCSRAGGAERAHAIVAGKATSADAILELAGAQNVAAAVTGFRPLASGAIVELAPEAIVAMRRSGGNDAHDVAQLFSLEGLGRRRPAPPAAWC
jgi:iron complex transport system substrate-binding protein